VDVARERDGVSSTGQILPVIDSVLLQESDSAYLGRPVALAVGPEGDYYVADNIANRVLRFGADGGLRLIYGRSGQGPGELASTGPIGFLDDSLVLISDFSMFQLERYDRRSGESRGHWSYQGPAASIVTLQSGVWLGAASQSEKTGLVRISLKTDSARNLLPLPQAHLDDPRIAQMHAAVRVTGVGDSVIVGYSGFDTLLVTLRGEQVVDRLPVPRLHRIGTPVDLSTKLQHVQTQAEALRTASVLWNLLRHPSGLLLATNVDVSMDSRNPEVMTFRVYTTIVDPVRRVACSDVTLDFADGVARPQLAMDGDTPVTLVQRVVGDQAVTVIRRHALVLEACEWVPID